MSKNREKLGSVWVDTATLLIADPCQVLQQKDKQTPTYQEMFDLFYNSVPQQETEEFKAITDEFKVISAIPPGERTPEQVARYFQSIGRHLRLQPPPRSVMFPEDHNVIAVRVENDGYYPVYLESNKDGTPKRIVIELGGHVEP